MQVGINYPWFSNTFGDTLFHPDLIADFRETLAQLEPRGVSVVRVWLLCQLDRWGVVDSSAGVPRFVPPAPGAFRGTGPGRSEPLQRFEALCVAAAEHRIRLVPSLICHGAFGDLRRDRGNGGRAAVAEDPHLASFFFDEVLESFLEVARPYREHVHSFELMNEPTWNVLRILGWTNPAYAPGLGHDALARFLARGLERIERAGFPSTVGHAAAVDLSRWPTGTVPQFHYYGLPHLWVEEHAVTRAYVGELSSSAARLWPRDPTEVPWPMLWGRDLIDDETAVAERLALLARQGYPLALLWPARGEGPGWEKYTHGALRALERFAGGARSLSR